MAIENQKQHKGFTLIELLLVFAVIIGVVLASYHRYQQYILEKDLAIVKQNVALLMDALNTYYNKRIIQFCPPHRLCSMYTQSCPNYSRRTVIDSNDNLTNWPNNLLTNNLVKDKNLSPSNRGNIQGYKVSTSDGIQIDFPQHLGECIYDPKAPPLDTYYTHNLIVTVTLDPNIVNITSMDWYLKELGASKNIPGTTQLQWIQMPGYSIKGISSDLWMMEGGLRTFKKGLEGTVTP